MGYRHENQNPMNVVMNGSMAPGMAVMFSMPFVGGAYLRQENNRWFVRETVKDNSGFYVDGGAEREITNDSYYIPEFVVRGVGTIDDNAGGHFITVDTPQLNSLAVRLYGSDTKTVQVTRVHIGSLGNINSVILYK